MVPSMRARTKRRDGRLTIGSLSRATGVPVATLRTWERRYHVPTPERKPSGHRLYPLTAIRHVRALKAALDQGHRPVEVMALGPDALEALVARGWIGGDDAPEATDRTETPGATEAHGGSRRRLPGVEILWRATDRLDRAAFRFTLRREWNRLGPLRFSTERVGPLLRKIGEAWAKGSLGIRHEHFASAQLAAFLREARRPLDDRAAGPRVVATTLAGDRHELGVLMASTILAANGWRVLDLGPDTPVEQLIALVEDLPVDAMAIGVSGPAAASAAAALGALRGAVPASTRIWIGGDGAPEDVPGVRRIPDLAALDRIARDAARGTGVDATLG